LGWPNKRQRSHIDCANERKKEDMKMSMKDRKKMMVRVEDWIGSDASRADLIEIIAQVALGEYTAKQLKEDVLSYDI